MTRPDMKTDGRRDRSQRRWFLRRSALVCVFFAVFVGSRRRLVLACSRAAPQADLRPIPNQNVLLITIDTLRADALGRYGGPAATPALDRLAAEGVRFDFAHAHAVTTLTSHASILTGTYPFQHGVRDNSGYRLRAERADAGDAAESRRAIETAAFVGAFPLHSRFGLNQGFDRLRRSLRRDARADRVRDAGEARVAVVPLARDVDRGTWGGGRRAGRPGRPEHGANARGSCGCICSIRTRRTGRRRRSTRSTQARPYYGEVAATDAALAPLLDDLRAAPRPTLVIVTGDHGEALGDHGELSHGLFAYESTLRIPLIIAELAARARRLVTAVRGGPA